LAKKNEINTSRKEEISIRYPHRRRKHTDPWAGYRRGRGIAGRGEGGLLSDSPRKRRLVLETSLKERYEGSTLWSSDYGREGGGRECLIEFRERGLGEGGITFPFWVESTQKREAMLNSRRGTNLESLPMRGDATEDAPPIRKGEDPRLEKGGGEGSISCSSAEGDT